MLAMLARCTHSGTRPRTPALLQILATAPIVGTVFDATDYRKPLWAVGMAFLTLYTYAPHAPVPLLPAAGSLSALPQQSTLPSAVACLTHALILPGIRW